MKKTGTKKYYGLKVQLTVRYSILIGILIVGILSSLAYYYNNRFMEYRISLIHSAMTSVTDSVENKIREIRNVAYTLRNNRNVYADIEKGELSPYVEQSIEDCKTYDIKDIIIIDNQGRPVGGEEEKNNIFDAGKSPGYQQYLCSNREDYFSVPHAYPSVDMPDSMMLKSNITYYFKMRDEDSMKVYGTVGIIASNNCFTFDKKELIQSEFKKFYLVDKELSVIYASREEGAQLTDMEDILNKCQKKEQTYFLLNDRQKDELVFCNKVDSYPNWYLIGVVSADNINRLTRDFSRFVLLFGIVIVLLAALLSSFIAEQISKPLRDTAVFMERYKAGETEEKLVLSAKSKEVAILQNDINKVLDRIEENIQTIVYEQEQNKLAEVEKIWYQLQSLQQQINPHFLYNTLNVIRYLAMEERGEDIVSFVQSFTKLLRATLGNTEDEITIRKEIEFLDAYIHIMEFRYKDMFELRIHMNREIMKCRIPKLLLQPIVENALIHGGFPSGRFCIVEVNGILSGRELRIEIKDNGIGISRDKLETILEKNQNFNGIALTNVNERLVLAYGEKSRLHFESQENIGTTVSFTIPVGIPEEDDGQL